jgi:AcrR family transcriptional regulator
MTTTHTDVRRKEEFLAEAVDYVLTHGLSDLSLRPLAAALGTSGRMLVYYFGSKDRLITDILHEVRRRKQAELADAPGKDVLRSYWSWAKSPEGLRYLRLVNEIYGLSMQHPERFGEFLAEESREVLAFISGGWEESGADPSERGALSTYTFATLRGLELDLLTTGETTRLEAAFAMFEADIERRVQKLRRPGRVKEMEA